MSEKLEEIKVFLLRLDLKPDKVPTYAEYKKKYREKLFLHPDKSGNDTEEVFKEITEAANKVHEWITENPELQKTNTEVEDDSEIERKKQLCPIKPVVTPEQESSPQDVKIVPKTLRFPSRSPNCQNQGLETVSTTPSSPSIREKAVSLSQEEVKEEVKQKIGAKELAGQRQLERKRLNKMLSIFDDQKIVK